MDKKGKSVIIFGLIAVLALAIFAVIGIAHINPQGKQTHPQGLDTKSCQDALAGAEEQLADRGTINPRLLDNIEDKCGVKCNIEFGEWTKWFDRDNPSAIGDFETLNELYYGKRIN